jgi:catechol 2,3-dioxygenase-like lactoylglutathione lyase family enzyme
VNFMAKLRPRGVDHLAIHVRDLGAAREFYVGLIGCEFIEALPRFNQELLHAGTTPISLVCRPAEVPAATYQERPESGLDHFCLLLEDDAADLRKSLSEAGVAVEDEVLNQEEAAPTLSLYVRDPSGNLVELRAPLRHDSGAGQS